MQVPTELQSSDIRSAVTLEHLTSAEVEARRRQAMNAQAALHERFLLSYPEIKQMTRPDDDMLRPRMNDALLPRTQDNDATVSSLLSPTGEAVARASASALLNMGVDTWSELSFPAPPSVPHDRVAVALYAQNVDKFLVAQNAVLQEKNYVYQLPIPQQSTFMQRRDELIRAAKQAQEAKIPAPSHDDATPEEKPNVPSSVFQKLLDKLLGCHQIGKPNAGRQLLFGC